MIILTPLIYRGAKSSRIVGRQGNHVCRFIFIFVFIHIYIYIFMYIYSYMYIQAGSSRTFRSYIDTSEWHKSSTHKQ